MATRRQIKVTIRENLSDMDSVRFSDDDLNDSFQDAYDDIVALTQCLTKTATLNWENGLSYYDFKASGVTDYMATLAIFDNNTNRFLRDDVTIRDYDNLRRDWETWVGTPQYWAPVSPTKIAIAAKYQVTTTPGAFNPFAFSNAFYIGSYPSSGTFQLLYNATAPIISSDDTAPLIANDMQNLFEFYVTAEMLEQDEQFVKADGYFAKYYKGIDSYAKRVKTINKHDLLMRV